jgi:hypothetical protein
MSVEHKYKKYILFLWHNCECYGGIDDIADSFHSEQEAIQHAQKLNKPFNALVVDRDSWEPVWRR